MTTATPAQPLNSDNRRTCPTCHKRFRAKTSRQKFCNAACSKKRTVTKPAYVIPRSAPFCQYLIREVRRAGLVQILEGHTVESLTELYKMVAYRFKANKYCFVDSDEDEAPYVYSLSHIVPVVGTSELGLLHPQNLVVSLTSQNRQHGTKRFGTCGKSIPRTAILPKWRINPKSTNDQIFEMILSLIGKAKFTEFAKAVKLKPSKRQQHIDTLTMLLDKSDPEHEPHFRLLNDTQTSTQALGALVQLLQGKTVSGFRREPEIYFPFRVYRDEAIRLSQYRPELRPLADMLTEISEFMWRQAQDDPWLMPWECSALFDVLHGKSPDRYQEVFEDMRHNALHRNSEAYHKYLSDAVDPAPVEAPVRVLQTLSTFVDELDGPTPYVVPVSDQTGYVEPPTPWD